MRKLIFAFAICAMALAGTDASLADGYLTPPKTIVDILDAEPTPTVTPSPDHRTLAIFRRRSMPTIAEVAEPMLRLGGHRINPKINGPHLLRITTSLALKPIAGGRERPVALPAGANLLSMGFSPDGKRLAVGVVRPTGIELWIVDVATGQAKALTGPTLNATFSSSGGPGQTPNACDWLDSSAELLCSFVSQGRGPAPVAPAVPTGPNVQEYSGRPAPAATFQDLLETEHDEQLFEYYFTGQLAYIDAATGRRANVGRPGIHNLASPSSDGQYVLVSRLKRPFSRLRPSSAFAKDVEIWNRAGQVVRKIGDLPLAEDIPINGVEKGPRGYRWNAAEPATVVWVEALDEGDQRKKVPHRDQIFALKAPFTETPAEVVKTEMRFDSIAWTDAGVALVTENDRPARRTRTWILDPGATQPRKLWDRSSEDRYGDPGDPMIRFGLGRIIQTGDWIYTTGEGASPEGDRPFFDRVSLKTGASERLFRSDNQSYETVEALLSDDGKRVLTQYQTKSEPPNYCVRDLNGGTRQALTAFKDPHPQITPATMNRQFVTYRRDDGVLLSGTIYLPADHKPGQRLPMIVWAYPREFTNADAASQVVGSPNRFTAISGASHLLLSTQGYAIFDGPTMPIVGEGETANDQYVEQLVSSAKAAIDKASAMGIADPDRVGVGGHSYGAFMTANLLAHSDLFRAGIARSGAYNRTLTPFGFQNERRTFWEARDVYAKMSPFFFADKINEPILLMHGEADNNSGTYPIQTDRLYMALKGHGATVRYVTLPLESHGYSGRESVLHTVAEMLNWMNKYVRDARPKETTASR
jgi:dipeptidyl aminopeptidase/acylaminoacyl peptidase